ncbi:hypothetical protein QR680_013154 [Steinernema hermaphroditum]|uniref:Ground-like domain-containing protein n=1 Tax=Steinernema hermaphroditum TaxID=289476 RepID=A0AA39M226_9BILA|nr:hypothetical protein QR680_013154 [Steinernema hermaphroditum]
MLVFFVVFCLSLPIVAFGCAPGSGCESGTSPACLSYPFQRSLWRVCRSRRPTCLRQRKQMPTEDAARRHLTTDIKGAIYEAAEKYASSGVGLLIQKVETTLRTAQRALRFNKCLSPGGEVHS